MKILFLLLLSVAADALSAVGARTVMTMTSASIGAASAQVLAAKQTRAYLLLQNKGTTAVYCKTQGAVTDTEGILLAANGGFWEPLVIPVDAIHCKSSDSTTNSVLAIEGAN